MAWKQEARNLIGHVIYHQLPLVMGHIICHHFNDSCELPSTATCNGSHDLSSSDTFNGYYDLSLAKMSNRSSLLSSNATFYGSCNISSTDTKPLLHLGYLFKTIWEVQKSVMLPRLSSPH